VVLTTGRTGQDCQSSHEIIGRAVGDAVTVGTISGWLVWVGKGNGVDGTSVAMACVPQATRRNPRNPDMRRRKYFTGITHLIPLTAYPAIIGGAAKTNSEGGESFNKGGGSMTPT
jgi:hypothetical protein